MNGKIIGFLAKKLSAGANINKPEVFNIITPIIKSAPKVVQPTPKTEEVARSNIKTQDYKMKS